MEGLYLLTLKLHETSSGNLLSGQEIKNPSLVDLMSDIQHGSAELLRQGLNIALPPITKSKAESIDKTPLRTTSSTQKKLSF